MSNELQTNLDKILEDKNTNLLPENLKAGVTCLGVEGTMTAGIDTSDATATTSDILSDKTAYVNGEKITGSIPKCTYLDQELDPSAEVSCTGSEATGGRIYVSGTFDYYVNASASSPIVAIDATTKYIVMVENSLVAEAIGLTADKIKAGETILGVTGTYDGFDAEDTDWAE